MQAIPLHPLLHELSPLQELTVKKSHAPRDPFAELHLTEFGDFIAQTAALLWEAGWDFEEIADALDPGNLRPRLPVADDGSRVEFVQCPNCTCRIPAPEEVCFNCGGPLHACKPRHPA